MKKLIIFGNSDFAEHVHYQLKHHSDYEIVAFTVDKKYSTSDTFLGLPVVNFELIEQTYPADEYAMFIALGYSNMNKLRKSKFLEAKSKGYELISFVHPSSVVAQNAVIGENCFIFENCVVQPFVKMSDNVIVFSSAVICHTSIVGKHSFICSNVCINGNVLIEENCFVGANSTIRDGLVIAKETLIGAGCTLLENTETSGVYKSLAPTKLDMSSNEVNI